MEQKECECGMTEIGIYHRCDKHRPGSKEQGGKCACECHNPMSNMSECSMCAHHHAPEAVSDWSEWKEEAFIALFGAIDGPDWKEKIIRVIKSVEQKGYERGRAYEYQLAQENMYSDDEVIVLEQKAVQRTRIEVLREVASRIKNKDPFSRIEVDRMASEYGISLTNEDKELK